MWYLILLTMYEKDKTGVYLLENLSHAFHTHSLSLTLWHMNINSCAFKNKAQDTFNKDWIIFLYNKTSIVCLFFHKKLWINLYIWKMYNKKTINEPIIISFYIYIHINKRRCLSKRVSMLYKIISPININ